METSTLRALIPSFRDSLIAQGRSESTAQAYCSDIRRFATYVDGRPGNDDVFTEYAPLAEDFINTERSTEKHANTILRHMSSLRAFYHYLRSVPVDATEPFVSYKAPRLQRASAHPLPGLMVDVNSMIVAAWRPHHKVLIALCGYAGLRVSEARSITPRDLFQDADDNWWLAVHGKGGVYREVPVSDELLQVIAEYGIVSAPDQPYVNLSDRAARAAITNIGRRAGITRNVSSHDLRHTFGTSIYSKTKDLRVTQELMGHASSSTTEGYTQVAQQAKLQAVKS